MPTSSSSLSSFFMLDLRLFPDLEMRPYFASASSPSSSTWRGSWRDFPVAFGARPMMVIVKKTDRICRTNAGPIRRLLSSNALTLVDRGSLILRYFTGLSPIPGCAKTGTDTPLQNSPRTHVAQHTASQRFVLETRRLEAEIRDRAEKSSSERPRNNCSLLGLATVRMFNLGSPCLRPPM